jgi:nicotinamide-nucleotide amidase
MQAIILSIGDELVLGQTIDTNSAWLSQQLAAIGCAVAEHRTVADNQRAIESAITLSIAHCEILLISGGIGPTADDLTRQALAAVMGVPLEINEIWLANLLEFFRSRGREMPEINKIQAMIPHGATMIHNTAGTAAGIDAKVTMQPRLSAQWTEWLVALEERLQSEQQRIGASVPHVSNEYMEQMFGHHHVGGHLVEQKNLAREVSERMGQSTRVFVMPGVPKEMKAMFTRDVLPNIRALSDGAVILSRTLHTFGLGESAVAEKLGDLMRRDRNPSVGTTVSGGVVSLRINARYPAPLKAQEKLDETANQCRAALGELIYGQDEQLLSDVVSQLLFKSPGITVTAAESCTGGLLAKMLTDTPGSSAYFKRGWVTYANEAKTDLLGVSPHLLREPGAVSEPVVRAMAAGARERANATFALAISGIAGPDGGTPQKPVGTVWIALAHPNGCDARMFIFSGDREMIRDRSAKMALTMLRFQLLGKAMPF